MGDAGEGWVDAEARIQERLEELRHDRAKPRVSVQGNPDQLRQIAALNLARQELARQLQGACHPSRRGQLEAAIADLGGRIAALESGDGTA